MGQGGHRAVGEFTNKKIVAFDTCNDIFRDWCEPLAHTTIYDLICKSPEGETNSVVFRLRYASHCLLVVLYANFSSVLCRLNNFTFFSTCFIFVSFWKRKKYNSHNLGLARVFFTIAEVFRWLTLEFFFCISKMNEWDLTRGRSTILKKSGLFWVKLVK